MSATPSSRLFLGLIPWYGLLIVLGAAGAILLADREARRQQLPQDTIIDLALRVLPLGILGARLYYVFFSWPTFAGNPISVLYIWEGGLAIYGGLIAGLVTTWVFCRRRRLSLRMMLDLLIPGVALAQALGRWGNYFNQEAYGWGISSASPFAFFPLAVFIQADGSWHLATFFYESLLDFGIFLFLLWGRRKLFRREGDVFLFYVIFYAAGRLVIENLRMDSLYLGGAVRVSQLLSVLLCAGATALLFVRRGKAHFLAPWHRILFGFSLLWDLALLLFCLQLSPLTGLSAKAQLLLLIPYAAFHTIFSLLLYGRSDSSEVRYANHKA